MWSEKNAYASWPRLTRLFPLRLCGAQFKRLWPIACERETLARRWRALGELAAAARAGGPAELAALRAAFVERRDRVVDAPPAGRRSQRFTGIVDLDPQRDSMPKPVPYAYRAFDRRWALYDPRLGDFIRRRTLGALRGPRQVFVAGLLTKPGGPGPALVATAELPDMDFFCGRGARDIIPLFSEGDDDGGDGGDGGDGARANVDEGALAALSAIHGQAPGAEELFAYALAIAGGPAYSGRFAAELQVPGPRLPIPRDRDLFGECVALGRALVGLQTWGARMAAGAGPGRARIVRAIPEAPPERYAYDPERGQLRVGAGLVDGVSPEVAGYHHGSFRVLDSWLAHRMRGPAGRARRGGALDRIRAERWTHDAALLELLWTLEACVALWPRLTAATERVVAGPTIAERELPGPARCSDRRGRRAIATVGSSR